jgi:hypothetical protein
VRTFDRFDGERWSRSSARVAKLALARGRATLRQPSGQDPGARPLGPYQVFIEQPLGDYIPAAAVPARISFPATAQQHLEGLQAAGLVQPRAWSPGPGTRPRAGWSGGARRSRPGSRGTGILQSNILCSCQCLIAGLDPDLPVLKRI